MGLEAGNPHKLRKERETYISSVEITIHQQDCAETWDSGMMDEKRSMKK